MAGLPESIRTIWAVAQKPCGFCKNGEACEARPCRSNVSDIFQGKPASTTLYPKFTPLQDDVFAYCDTYKRVVESESKPHAADTLFFPAFLRLAKSEGGEKFKNIDIDLILKAVCCFYGNEVNIDFCDYAEVLCNPEYQAFCEYLVYWSRESQNPKYHKEGGYYTDLIMNMAVILYNLLQVIQPTFIKVKRALDDTVDFPRGDELAAAW